MGKSRAKSVPPSAAPAFRVEPECFLPPGRLPVTVNLAPSPPPGQPSPPEDRTDKRHWHGFHELILIAEGTAIHEIDDLAFPVVAGDVFLIQGEQVHRFAERKGLTAINLIFDPERLPLPHDTLRQLPGYRALFELEPAFRRQHRFRSHLHLSPQALEAALRRVRTALEWQKRPGPGTEVRLLALLLELMVELAERYAASPTPEGQALLRLGDILRALEARSDEEWNVAELARRAGLSRNQFLRTFRQATGFSPIDYVLRLRIRRAMELLAQGGQSITHLAFAVGFRDSNYFARQFRRLVGQSPTVCRRAVGRG